MQRVFILLRCSADRLLKIADCKKSVPCIQESYQEAAAGRLSNAVGSKPAAPHPVARPLFGPAGDLFSLLPDHHPLYQYYGAVRRRRQAGTFGLEVLRLLSFS